MNILGSALYVELKYKNEFLFAGSSILLASL
nr:MAG TPA_asm: hypothetical protein [Bacteriophage sp.]